MHSHDVLMIGWEYPPHNSGGLGVACQGLTQALAQQNTHIYFTLPYSLPSQVSHMDIVECIHPDWSAGGSGSSSHPPFYAYTGAVSDQPSPPTPAQFSRAALSALPQSELEYRVHTYAEKVEETAEAVKHKVSGIHAHDWMSFPAAMRASNRSGKPYIAHIHSTEYDRIPSGHGSHYIMHTEYEGMMHARRVVAVSYYTKQLLVTKYGIPADKIDVVHNGVDPLITPAEPGRHHFAHGRPIVTFMGRLTMQKGAEYFLALAQRVLEKVPNALFIIAGNGDMYHSLLLRTAHEHLSASVLFSGFIRGAQKDVLLDRTDVFVMPSLSEPFGLVALEAAQRHTPVIVSKNSGVNEVLPSSLSIDFWDVDKMSDGIVELLTNESSREHMIQNQLQELRSVTWDAAAGKLETVYKNAFGTA